VRVMSQQRGAAMVAVLLILLAITLLGITGVRMGLTSLTIATNSQVSAITFQEADSGLITFAQRVSANPSAAALPTGVIGPALSAPGTEVRYCKGKTDRLRAGVCTAGVAEDYTTGRQIALNQMAVEVPAAADGTPMKAIVLGSDMDRAGIPTYRVNVHSTSLVPVVGAADADEINECLLNRPNDDDGTTTVETVTDCLTDAGAVFTTMVQEYDFGFN